MTRTPKELSEIILGELLEKAGGEAFIKKKVNEADCGDGAMRHRDKWRLKKTLTYILTIYKNSCELL